MTVRLLLISGSTRGASSNTAALRAARDEAPAGTTAVLYGGLTDLPAFVPDDVDSPGPAVVALREALSAADAVVFCTPEYAGSMPGSLKNLLDWTVGSADMYRKPAAWINVAAPGRGAGALDQLRTVLGYVEAVVLEEACVAVPVPRAAIGAAGEITDAELRRRLGAVLGVVARLVTSIRSPRSRRPS